MIDPGALGLYEEIDDARPRARDSCTSYATENTDYLTVVLPCVLQTHKALRQKTHKKDNLTGLILDMIESMLSPSHVRLDARQCAFQTTNILQKAEAMIDDTRNELRRSALPPTISIPPSHSSNQSLSARISPQNSPSPARTSQNVPNGMTPNGSLTPLRPRDALHFPICPSKRLESGGIGAELTEADSESTLYQIVIF